MAKQLTEDVWLAELSRIQHTPVDGLTMREIMDKTGLSEQRARRAVGLGICAGRCVCVGRKPITRIDGQGCTVPAYRLIRKGKK